MHHQPTVLAKRHKSWPVCSYEREKNTVLAAILLARTLLAPSNLIHTFVICPLAALTQAAAIGLISRAN
jgi:hypothetical protein